MLKLKRKLKSSKPATELAVSPITGCAPPKQYQFKSGAEWRGNAGGRARILREESVKYLNETDKNGTTNARRLIESMGSKALSDGKNAVAAFQALRRTVEPSEKEANGQPDIDYTLVRMVLDSLNTRRIDAVDLPPDFSDRH